MSPRSEEEPLIEVIWSERDAATRGARAGHCPKRDVEDVVQDTLLITCCRARCGVFVELDDRRKLRASIGAYLFTVAKHLALERWRKVGQVMLMDELPEPAIDPLPRLEARSELRTLPDQDKLRDVYKALAFGDSVMDYVRESGTCQGTAYSLLMRLRKRMGRR